ncbi:MAG: hypothetical protein HY506_01310 [Candidatus Yanofskybacteria bacterium]|nr:hypothetical protein [Candidatus Yanofskybacteria bacterium]
MSARVAIPILTELKKKGVETLIIAEGRAATVCKESGWPLVVEGNDDLKPFGKERVKEQIRVIKPDVVLVGTGLCPSNWELEFALIAEKFGIPIVAVEDIWGGLSKLKDVVPDLTLIMDNSMEESIQRSTRRRNNMLLFDAVGSGNREYEKEAVNRVVTEEKEDLERYRSLSRHWCIIGDIASTVDAGAPPDKLAMFNETIQDKTSVLIVGDHLDNVLELVEMVVASIKLEKKPGDFIIVTRLVHPKLVNDPSVAPTLEAAKRLLEGLVVNRFDGISTDALAARCNYTCTCYSTPLRIAIHHGQRAISVQGPKSNKLMKDETGFDEYPLVTAGTIPALTEPTRISLLDWRRRDPIARQWVEQTKFRPEAGAEAIVQLVKR